MTTRRRNNFLPVFLLRTSTPSFQKMKMTLILKVKSTVIICYYLLLSVIVVIIIITGRSREASKATTCRYCFIHGPIFGLFAPQGRHVALIKVKFGRECQISPWSSQGVGLWPQKVKNLELYQYNCPNYLSVFLVKKTVFLCAARWRQYRISNFKPRIFRFSEHVLLCFSEQCV